MQSPGQARVGWEDFHPSEYQRRNDFRQTGLYKFLAGPTR